ncbi:MAG: hypothetical protein RL685_6693 [Pseudomonadota bacterium]|jgi:hypothetical protein
MLRSIWQRWLLEALSAVGPVSLVACGSGSRGETFLTEPAQDGAEAPLLGSLRIPLVTPDGQTYRLRAARLEIRNRSRELLATLDTDSEPDAPALRTELLQGFYDIQLRDGGRLEQARCRVVTACLSNTPSRSRPLVSAQRRLCPQH